MEEKIVEREREALKCDSMEDECTIPDEDKGEKSRTAERGRERRREKMG